MTTADLLLLERDRELTAMRVAAADCARGSGSTVLVHGEPGVGKTTLLNAAASVASDAGLRVLQAAGSELERDLGFGLIRELLGPVAQPATSRAHGPADAAHRVLRPRAEEPPLDLAVACHALQWLCSDLAEAGPLALVVDDAQWADEPSLRALAYLGRRLEGSAIVLVLALRTSEPRTALDDLLDAPASVLLVLERLSPMATAELLRAHVGRVPDAELVGACHAATGGNPFLLRELLTEIVAAGMPLDATSAPRVHAVAPGGVARSLERRLARLPMEARSLAAAVALFAAGAPLRHAAAVAGLSEPAAAAAADRLAGAGIVEDGQPLRFIHPLLQTAAYESQGTAARALAHRQIAVMLAEEGAEPEAVVAHLVRAQPAADPRAVDLLLAAAERALASGAPATALALARRALDEPPEPHRRGSVLHALGRAGVSVAWDEAGALLAAAADAAPDATGRAHSLLLWTQAWTITGGDARELRDRIDCTLPDVQRADPALAGRLRVRRRLLLGPGEWEEDLQAAVAVADVATLEGRITLVQWAWWQAVGARCAAGEAARTVRRALGGGPVADWSDPTTLHQYAQAIDVLRLSGAIDEAERMLEAGIRRAAAGGDDLLTAMGTVMCADYALERGLVADALALATTARDMAIHRGVLTLPVVQASGAIAAALIERGEVEAAVDAVAALDDPELHAGPRAMAATARAAALLAAGRPEQAARAALEHGRGPSGATVANPALDAWRAVASEALVQCGDERGARGLALEGLVLAQRWGAPAPLGEAYRVAARHAGANGAAVDQLSRGVELLRPTHARLWLARALTDLGAALRRAHRRGEARERLREGLELARECGAPVLAERAHDELRAAGARPRRPATRGLDALTPSELRVCRLAAGGLSNREIAQNLFVTLRTVESHLTASYAKLRIGGRNELHAALDPAPAQREPSRAARLARHEFDAA